MISRAIIGCSLKLLQRFRYDNVDEFPKYLVKYRCMDSSASLSPHNGGDQMHEQKSRVDSVMVEYILRLKSVSFEKNDLLMIFDRLPAD